MPSVEKLNAKDIQQDLSFLKSPIRAFLYAVKPYRVRLFTVLTLIIVGNVVAYSLPYFLKLIVDEITSNTVTTVHTLKDFWPLLIVITVLTIGHEFSIRVAHFLETTFVVKVFDRITTTLFGFLLNRPIIYFEERFSGELSRRVEQVSGGISFFLQSFPWEMGWIVLAFVMTAILLLTANIWLSIVFLAWLLLFLLTSFLLLKKQYSTSQNVSESQANLSGTLVDTFSNISLVHMFTAHDYEHQHYRRFMNSTISAENKERRIFFLNKLQQGASLILLTLSLIFTSVILFTKDLVTVGDFVLVTTAIPTLVGVIFNFGDMVVRSIRQYGEIKNSLESLSKQATELRDGNNQLLIEGATKKAAISFDNVSFSYKRNEAGEEVVKNLTLHILPGQKVGLVGRSGAGKSTIVKLLLRSYDLDKGSISINNQDISSLTINSIRKNIAFVPQDTSLFNRTLYENILYARPDATKEEVINASVRAYANDFIKQYPDGYDTLVGERGVKLSGGQRQRIALTRAILKDAPILVLDEATSALDSESEEIIQKGLQELFGERTVFAIAHRLSTLRAMDRIIVLEHGSIVEDGNPQDLLAKENSLFKDMWEHQKRGFI